MEPTNMTIRDLDFGNDVIPVIPQDEALNLDIKFYFSDVSSTYTRRRSGKYEKR